MKNYVIRDKDNKYIYPDSSAGGYPSRSDSLLGTFTISKEDANSYVKVMHEKHSWTLFEVVEDLNGIKLVKTEWNLN